MRRVDIGAQVFSISTGLLTTMRLDDEWYEDLEHPDAVIEAVRTTPGIKPDLFTFWQRLPDAAPKFPYHKEWESIAALPVTSYEDWWKRRVNSKVRALVRKAEKTGVTVRQSEFTDEFVEGMLDIFNETPVRQNRPFWHYGKSFDTVKHEFSRFLFREQVLGAYYQGELIGFVMLADAGRYAVLSQIISKIVHRDKATNNALIAKAVEACSARDLPYLVYANWPEGPLADFKRQNGFERVDLPRYFVPLSAKGALALRCGAHRGWKHIAPGWMRDRLKKLRKTWYGLREKAGPGTAQNSQR
jgi:hypothetical protein